MLKNVYDLAKVAYTILSRKTCDGEQKLFLRINLHINADWTVVC